MSNIGRARDELRDIARQLREAGEQGLANRLQQVVSNLMYRRTAARRMAIRSQPVTPEIREEVLRLARETDMHSAEIAAELNLNPGRVSEILQGDR